MKLTIVCAALLFGSVAFSDLLAQGQLIWGNNFSALTPAIRAPIYGVDAANPTQIKRGNTSAGLPAGTQTYGGAGLLGTGFTAAIYLGNDTASTMANLMPVETAGTAGFRTSSSAAGLLNQQTATDPSRAPGAAGVNYQIRAWDNKGGTVTSWAQVMASGGQVAGGSSDVYVFSGVLGGGAITPPFTDGIRSFQLTQVPEPSLIALGALGLGALLLRRRK